MSESHQVRGAVLQVSAFASVMDTKLPQYPEYGHSFQSVHDMEDILVMVRETV